MLNSEMNCSDVRKGKLNSSYFQTINNLIKANNPNYSTRNQIICYNLVIAVI